MSAFALSSIAAWWILAVVAAAVVLLYLLKPSPRRLLVASTLIWRRVLSSRKRVPDRLRWWLSLLLALSIALCVALAFTRPQLTGLGEQAQRVALVLDNSTTLGALTTDGRRRFDHASERARETINSGGPESRYLVADTQRTIASPRFETRDAALATLERLHVVAGGAPVFPDVVAGGDAQVRTVFVTDGVAGIEPGPGVETVSVFQIADNVGITAFDVRPIPGDARRHEAYVELANASAASKKTELQIAGAGSPPFTRVVDVPSDGTANLVVDVSRFSGGPLRASITTAYDALPVDDVAFSFLPSHRAIQVALVTPGNAALERSLRLLPRVELTVMTPQRFSARSGIDAWIFDRYAPRAMPNAPALLFRPSRVDWLPRSAGDTGETTVSAWSNSHPITDSLSLRDVLAQRALAIRDGARASVIATDASRRALILASASGPRWIEVAFALEDSNLPSQSAFPVFLNNAINWMTGEPLALQSGLGLIELPLADARVLDLAGEKVATRQVPGATLIEAAQPGFYTGIAADRRVRMAANVLDPRVTRVNDSSLAATPAPAPKAAVAARMTSAPWTTLLVIAALLLAFEWWTYNRRFTL
ncbi:MAG: BatA domain-containing protein [Betaproteobacteria bacterium]